MLLPRALLFFCSLVLVATSGLGLWGCCVSGPCYDYVPTNIFVAGKHHRAGPHDSSAIVVFVVKDSLESRHPFGGVIEINPLDGLYAGGGVTLRVLKPDTSIVLAPGSYRFDAHSLYRDESDRRMGLEKPLMIEPGDSIVLNVTLGGVYMYRY